MAIELIIGQEVCVWVLWIYRDSVGLYYFIILLVGELFANLIDNPMKRVKFYIDILFDSSDVFAILFEKIYRGPYL